MRLGRENCLLVVLPTALLVAGWMLIRPFTGGAPHLDAGGTHGIRLTDGESGPIASTDGPPLAPSILQPTSRSIDPTLVEDADDGPADVANKWWVARVVGFDGKVLSGAEVRVRWIFGTTIDGELPLDPRISFEEIYRTNEDGELRVPLAAGFRFEAFLAHEGYGRARVPEFSATSEIVLPPSRVVEGRVADESGRPLVGAVVTLRDGAGEPLVVRTDSEGKYRIEGVGVGTAFVDVRHPDMRPESIALKGAGSSTLNIGAFPGGTASGSIAAAASSSSGDSGTVSLFDRWGRSIVETKPLSENGEYAFTGLIPGRDYLATVIRGGASGESAFRAGVGSPDVVVAETATIVASVFDEFGAPLPGAVLTLRRFDGLPSEYDMFAVSDGEGVAVLDGVRPGVQFRVVVYAPGYGLFEFRNVVATPGEHRQASCNLFAAAPFSGRVTSVDGSPIAGAAIRIARADGYWSPALFVVTDADGYFEAFGVAPGKVSAAVLAAGFAYERTTIEAPKTGATNIALVRAPVSSIVVDK